MSIVAIDIWFVGFAVLCAGMLICVGLFRLAGAVDEVARRMGGAMDGIKGELSNARFDAKMRR